MQINRRMKNVTAQALLFSNMQSVGYYHIISVITVSVFSCVILCYVLRFYGS